MTEPRVIDLLTFSGEALKCVRLSDYELIRNERDALLAKRKPLTDEEIATIVREASKGSALNRGGSTSLRIARAIEKAHGIGVGE